MYNVDDAVARVDSYVVSVTGGGGHVGERRMVRIEEVGRSVATASLLDAPGNGGTGGAIGGRRVAARIVRLRRPAPRPQRRPASLRHGEQRRQERWLTDDTYAIVETGGKQYRAEEGASLLVERMADDEGAKVTLRPVMFSGDKDVIASGSDLEKVKVEATVAEHLRGPKIRIFKHKAKKGYRRRAGHRQALTRLEVTEVRLLTRKPAATDEGRSQQPRSRRKKPAKPAGQEGRRRRSLPRRSLQPRSPRRRSPRPRKSSTTKKES